MSLAGLLVILAAETALREPELARAVMEETTRELEVTGKFAESMLKILQGQTVPPDNKEPEKP